MDENIKKLISEAFNELYSEMMSEAPETEYAVKGMTMEEIPAVVKRALNVGYDPRLRFDFETGTEQEANFNSAIDQLINVYKTSKDPQEKANAKTAVQYAFSPESKRFQGLIKSYRNRKDFKDMVDDIYEIVLLQGFDRMMGGYKNLDGTFGGLVTRALRNAAVDYVKKGRRARGGSFAGDVYHHGSKGDIGMISVDDYSYGEEGRSNAEKIGDYDEELEDVGDAGLAGLEDAPEVEFRGKGKIDTLTARQLIDYIIEWFEEEESQEAYADLTPERAIIFREFVRGASAAQIWEENPEIQQAFPNPKPLSQEFRRLTKSQAGKDISKIISRHAKINFDLSQIDPMELKQIYAQNPSFTTGSPKGGTSEISSHEMLKIQGEIQDILDELGVNIEVDSKIDVQSKEDEKSGEFKKFKKLFKNLQDQGREDVVRELENLLHQHVEAKAADKERGGYGAPKRYVPQKSSQETDEFRGMFEGIDEKDVDKLMERVLRRLSK
jgi:DNA-directed RNA polymerase specialized sigma24 family protein